MKLKIASEFARARDPNGTGAHRRVEWWLLAAAVLLLLCVRLPFLPPSLEDVDSVNFYLGVHEFNPVAHQPHPPGYPVYIFLAKLVCAVAGSGAAGLGLLSALLSAMSVVPLYLLMKRLGPPLGAALACALTVVNPLFWFNGVRPMSDATGFFAVVTSQALLLMAAERNAADARRSALWCAGALAAGLAIGTRLQAAVLVGPLLLYAAFRVRSLRLVAAGLGALVCGVVAWLVPLVWYSGGPAQLMASFVQLVRNSLPVEPLVATFSPRAAVIAGLNVAVAPWQDPRLAAFVLVLAAAGTILLAAFDRRTLALALLLFLPYALYHYLLQWTETVRYAIPIVPLVGLLASAPATRCRTRLARRLATASCALVIAAAAVITVPALSAYHETPSPPSQALNEITRLVSRQPVPVAGNYVFERYLSLLPAGVQVLRTLPREEWRALGEYWKGGGRRPILFLREPNRTMLMLIERDAVKPLARWRWPGSVASFMKGERPNDIELVEIDPPRWFCESGFFVTREAGPPETVALQRHIMYVRPAQRRSTLIVSGAEQAAGPGEVTLNVGGRPHERWSVDGNFTIHTFFDPLPAADDYVPFSFATSSPVLFTDVWLAPADKSIVRPGVGFYDAERDQTSTLFRWMAPRARAWVYLPRGSGRLSIRGWVPVKYYRGALTVTLTLNGARIGSFAVTGETFHLEQALAGLGTESWAELSIETSQQFVPDERTKNGDRRVLSARIYEMVLQPPASDR